MTDDPLAEYRKLRKPQSNDSTRLTVLKQENEAGSLVGGKRHRGSGASPWKKSDASGKQFQVECKQTGADSLRVTTEWLKKISQEAIACGKEPALHVRFLKAQEDWVMIPSHVFKRLIQE